MAAPVLPTPGNGGVAPATTDPPPAPGGSTGQAHVVIIVQNLSVPFDRRVWLECQALRAEGLAVSVVCPRGPGDPAYAVLDGVHLYKYRQRFSGGRQMGFVAEYLYSFVASAWLVLKAARRRRITVLQACNPPDIFWPLGIALRLLTGARFVFDHHDLCPELYQSRFPDASRLPYWGLRAAEWCSHRSADHVIATNESYRRIAVERSGKDPDAVTIVRTGPDDDRLRRGPADASLRRGRTFLVAYLGVMGPQDGVDIVVRSAKLIAHDWGRADIAFTLIGSGDCFDELVRLRDELGLGDTVEFTGRAPDEVVHAVLSTADVGLSPDPKNPLNDVSTMNKTMEYMAFGLPVVAFDLTETRVSAGDAALYATPNRVEDFARAIVALLDDGERRAAMGSYGRARVEDELAWRHSRRAYVDVYRAIIDGNAPRV
ncbi:MAG TPA: glycosyltransferase family 4 protein [Acidimicrobiales bacterium]|nr:glycosyltransferase family 4 protein [Acidimicrobiales bacterium]